MSSRLTRAERRAQKRRNQRLALGVIVLLVLAVLGYFAYSAFIKPKGAASNGAAATGDFVTTASGLKYQDLTVGTGKEATAGSTVSVHYTGWLQDGTKFDSSLDRGQPLQFTLGQGDVIPGWDEGVAGMKEGGKRKLIIPPGLAYGAQGASGVIPPNATLTFDVELLSVK